MGQPKDPLLHCTGFEWDADNTTKNFDFHQVTPEEAEGLFLNQPLVIRSDIGHSRNEKRYFALGQSDKGRPLFAAFTIRKLLIRVISVRDMNRREGAYYESYEKETS